MSDDLNFQLPTRDLVSINPIQDGLFQGCSRMGRGQKGPPSLKSVTQILQWWNPKKIQKIYESRDTALEFCWHQHFFTRNQQILLYQEKQIQISFWYIISNYCKFFWVFNDCFSKYGYNFDDVSKNGYTRLSLNKAILKNGYDVIISNHDVTSKILSCDSNYVVGVVMWPKFGDCSISMKEVIITSIL